MARRPTLTREQPPIADPPHWGVKPDAPNRIKNDTQPMARLPTLTREQPPIADPHIGGQARRSRWRRGHGGTLTKYPRY